MSDTYKDESRKNWASDLPAPNIAQLQFGALQRIADAAELMSKNHQRLIEERDRYQQWYEQEKAKRQRLERSNRALRAWITRLKKKNADR